MVTRTHNSWIARTLFRVGSDSRDDIIFLETPAGHAVGTLTINISIAGQSTLLMSTDYSANACLEAIGREKVTNVRLVPIQLERLIDNSGKYDLSSLKLIIAGAGAISPRLGQKLRDWLEGKSFKFVTGYGSSEGVGS